MNSDTKILLFLIVFVIIIFLLSNDNIEHYDNKKLIDILENKSSINAINGTFINDINCSNATFTGQVKSNKICIGNTCIDENKLKILTGDVGINIYNKTLYDGNEGGRYLRVDKSNNLQSNGINTNKDTVISTKKYNGDSTFYFKTLYTNNNNSDI